MTERTDHLTDDAITQFLRTRSADPDLGLLDDIVRTAGATPQDRPWLGLRPIALPRRTLLIVAVALLVAAMGAVAVGSGLLLPVMPEGPFDGTWLSTSDTDGGTQTMTVRVSADDAVEITVRDDIATVCGGTPSTMTGTGRIEGGTQLVIPAPVYTCDDGSEPEALSGPPLEEQLRYLTFLLDPQTDTLTDNFGGLWLREGAEAPNPDPPEDLEEFLAARIAGTGAEGLVQVDPDSDVPLLYATTSGAPYERYEIERLDGPLQPDGRMTFSVRLFADGDATVVEQTVWWDPGSGMWLDVNSTTENGRPVTLSYTSSDGEVTVSAPSTWEMWWPDAAHVADVGVWFGGLWRPENFFGSGERIGFVDPVAYDSWCAANGGSPLLSAPADAAAIAQELIADPNFETTAPVAARIGGVEAVSIDVALAPGGEACGVGMIEISRWIHELWEPGWRLRLYLVDLPQGMSVQTLAITVVAPKERFEEFIEETAPIIESIEFHPG